MEDKDLYKTKNVVLLGAGYTTNNMGVWALSSGAINAILDAHKKAEISFFDYHEVSIKYSVKCLNETKEFILVNIRFSKKFWLPNNIARLIVTALLLKAIPFRSFRKKLIERNYWLSHLKKADIIAAISGGDSFSDIYGVRRLLFVALPQILVLILGKPLILLPQTIGPFQHYFSKAVARYILRHAKIVYSRDRDNVPETQKIMGKHYGRLEFCYDLGFVLEPYIEKNRIPSSIGEEKSFRNLIGLNISGLLFIGGYTENNMFGLKVDYSVLVNDIIRYFSKKHNCQIMLVPHVGGAENNKESDIVACCEIYKENEKEFKDNLLLLKEEYDHQELKALIGRCNFFIGSRMHSCIAALSQCVPAVGLAYSRKFKGVFNSIGVSELVIDLREEENQKIIKKIDKAFMQREKYRTILENKIVDVRKCIFGLFR